MPDPFYDELIAIALDFPGVWLAEDQGDYGIRFTCERPPQEVLVDLVDRFHGRAWRVENVAHRADHSTAEVISEIDRTVNVYLTAKAT